MDDSMEETQRFLCGVVEGFYGRPWSTNQRRVLFQWMQAWGLNTYLYAPKDDLKHRLLWREVYSAEEEGQLRALVSEANSRSLTFVYAVSPGQDMVFSSPCDLTLLKRKLRQVSDLGCRAFSILFDDIDHSLCQADGQAFASLAHAQVAVANEIYRFLGEPPVFLFCPTEYCGSLCSPSVSKSLYLQTVGENLLLNISVIWTGGQVVSSGLSVSGLSEVSSVLRRRPLIWDNLHANDYDSRRLFLGPFKGREAGLLPRGGPRGALRGLLLNPNCEFEANYIPLHTLGAWHRSGSREVKDESSEYCPDRALSSALHDWMGELNQPLQPGRSPAAPSSGRTKTPDRADGPPPARDTQTPDRDASPPARDTQTPDRVASPPARDHSALAKPLPVFPLTSGSPPGSPAKDPPPPPAAGGGGGGGGDGENTNRPQPPRPQRAQGRGGVCGGKGHLSESQVRLLVGLHYLPHEHGPAGRRLLSDLTWLKTHCHLVSTGGKKTPPHKVGEWRAVARSLVSLCDDIAELHCSVIASANRAALYDLYPYVWDLRNTALLTKAFTHWLDGRILSDSATFGSWKNCFHWCGTATGAELLDSEPWVFKGGVSGEVQMLLPLGGSSDLFTHPPPLFPTSRLYNIRPYHSTDKVELYRMVRQLHLRTRGVQEARAAHPDVIGDRCLGACLALSPEYCLVLEDELGVCGGVLGVLDVSSFTKRCLACWMPAMRDKYPPRGGATHPQDVVVLMEQDQGQYPDSLLHHFPSQLRLDALPELVDVSVSRTLLTACLSALKANGSQGVFCEVQPTDRIRMEFLTKLGFLEILRGEARCREGLVLGRML